MCIPISVEIQIQDSAFLSAKLVWSELKKHSDKKIVIIDKKSNR